MGWANWLHKANVPDSVKSLYANPRTVKLDQLTKNSKGYSIIN